MWYEMYCPLIIGCCNNDYKIRFLVSITKAIHLNDIKSQTKTYKHKTKTNE